MNPELKTRDKARPNIRRITGEKPEPKTTRFSSPPAPVMFRLERGPILCFQQLTHVFNRTMFRLRIPRFWPKTTSPRPRPRHRKASQAQAPPQRTNQPHATSNL